MTVGERIWIPEGDIVLEGLRWVPQRATAAPGVVLCHPHPLRGGNMKNAVIAAVWEALAPRGFALLRFNFRGVGRSGGEHDEGGGEVDDVRAALAFLASSQGVDAGCLAVVGYSFGAWTGGRAALSVPDVRAVGLIAPPLGIFSMEELKSETRPTLAIVGNRDEYCPPSVFREWFAGVEAPKEEIIVDGADHFLGGREEEVAGAVARFLESIVGETDGKARRQTTPTGEGRSPFR